MAGHGSPPLHPTASVAIGDWGSPEPRQGPTLSRLTLRHRPPSPGPLTHRQTLGAAVPTPKHVQVTLMHVAMVPGGLLRQAEAPRQAPTPPGLALHAPHPGHTAGIPSALLPCPQGRAVHLTDAPNDLRAQREGVESHPFPPEDPVFLRQLRPLLGNLKAPKGKERGFRKLRDCRTRPEPRVLLQSHPPPRTRPGVVFVPPKSHR